MSRDLFTWQQDDYNRIQDALTGDTRVMLVHGKDFSSPYHVMSSIYKELMDQNQILFCIQADRTNNLYPLLPFTRVLDGVVPRQKVKRLLPNIARDIFHSNIVAFFVDDLVNTQQCSFKLEAHTNEILTRIGYAAGGCRPIFIFCDYDEFDPQSKELALILASEQLDVAFPFLSEAKYIFLCEDMSDSYAKISGMEHVDVVLTDPKLENIQEIILEVAPEFFRGRKRKTVLLIGRASVFNMVTILLP